MQTELVYNPESARAYLAKSSYSKVVLISDTNALLHCLPHFNANYFKTSEIDLIVDFPAGEQYKSIDTANRIWNQLLAKQIDKNALIVALGGGVVTDVAGFVASAYKRGVSLVNVPTTHLAMIDAAIGAKNGVNFNGWKNQIGSIYSPVAVLIDPQFLKTLGIRELKSGFVETIKHAIIGDHILWQRIQHEDNLALALDPSVIKSSATVKQSFVNIDPFDNGIRQALNCGHSIGHAMESLTDWTHGESVAFGLIAEAFVAEEILQLSAIEVQQMTSVIKALNLDWKKNRVEFSEILGKLQQDKKNVSGKLKFSLVKAIGKPVTGIDVDEKIVAKAIEKAENALFK